MRRLLVAVALLAAASPIAAQPLLAPLGDGQLLRLPATDAGIPSPAEVLGYPLGARFTPHHRIVDYLQALAAASPRVELVEYGETYEGRPLLYAVISTEENLRRLDGIRAERRALASPAALDEKSRRHLVDSAPAVLWLGYGAHGNESSSAEAAMATAFLLAAGRGEAVPPLDDLVVLLDPLLNPDGRERYVHNFQIRRGGRADSLPAAAEHFEPWPGGRGNHYFVDLNRDWAWATQRETRDRIETFRDWEPQVSVDFHEMGLESTYFFPPPAEPVHPAIAAHTGKWLQTFGRGNAAAFDRLGWTYYVGEQYDLFYPAYGDTYPSLRGGVGMTYEMAGGGRAGALVELADGRTLTLADRIARHLVTSLATARTAAARSRQLVEEFVDFRMAATSRPPITYLWHAAQPEAKAMARLLTSHGIEVGTLERATELSARPLLGGELRPATFPAGTFAVSTGQPLGTLASVLLQRESKLPERYVSEQRHRVLSHQAPEFYDITAWSLPLAYNVETWVTAGVPPAASRPPIEVTGGISGGGEVGYLMAPQGVDGYRLAAALQRRGAHYRLALDRLQVGERTYPAGTLFVPRAGQEGLVDDELDAMAREAGVLLEGVSSSLTEGGILLGSDRMVPIRPVSIALLSGEDLSPTSVGFLWHLLDVMVDAPHTLVDLAHFDQVRLGSFDVLVMPDGHSYGDWLDDAGRQRFESWLREGGVVVAVGDSIEWLATERLTDLAKWRPDGLTPRGEELGTSGRVWRTRVFTPGAILATEMAVHPLTAGPPAAPPVLVYGDDFFLRTGDPRRDLLIARRSEPVIAGLAWPEATEQLSASLFMSVTTVGDGKIVLLPQHPAFRLFWRGTMPLVLNAALFGPSLDLSGE